MAVGILVMLYVHHPVIPELWDGLQNTNPEAAVLPIFPIYVCQYRLWSHLRISCYAKPPDARCMTSERHGRPVFYGAMITEGIVALIWAAAATYFYREHGVEENNASVIVDAITKDWLGAVGGVLAILGVIAAAYYIGRHRCFVRTPDRSRFSETGTKKHASPFVYLCADVHCRHRAVALQFA